MKIERLQLKNFRNFKNIDFCPGKNINYIYGLNGVGKTNLVESISFLSLGKSYKGVNDKILINTEEETFYLKAMTEDNNSFEIGVDKKNKIRKHNAIEIKRASDYIGRLKSVIFSVEDLDLIRGLPSDKRKYLDIVISQVDPLYLEMAISYKHLLEQKNIELKKEYPNKIYLCTLNEQLTQCIDYIQTKRKEFFDFINANIENIFNYVTNQNHAIRVGYITNISTMELNNLLDTEIQKRNAYYGIHRDSFRIKLDDLDAEDYSSQGQQRILVLCLKILQLKYIIYKTKIEPIFILDDVFSEIDEEKISRLLNYIYEINCQTFITTTELKNRKDYIDYFLIENEKIKKITD